MGHYCTQGEKIACPNTKYQDKIGKDACLACPAGYQCRNSGDGSLTTGADLKKVCGQNHYCPVDILHPVACTAGYYTVT